MLFCLAREGAFLLIELVESVKQAKTMLSLNLISTQPCERLGRYHQSTHVKLNII